MRSQINFVRNEILQYLRNYRYKAGENLFFSAFKLERMIDWTDAQKDLLKRTLSELESEGIIRGVNGEIQLTSLGIELLYPPVGDSVYKGILNFLRQAAIEAGGLVPKPAFKAQVYDKWDPRQQQACWPALEAMLLEGLLKEEGHNFYLTEAGYKKVNQEKTH